MNSLDLAQQCIAKMWATDYCSQHMGIKVIGIEVDKITTTMIITNQMLNGFNTCHGGQIFTLADSSFAFVSNINNEVTVAAGCDINFLAPAYLDDELTAVAEKIYKSNRLGYYKVTIVNQKQQLIALFHGRSYTIKGKTII